MAALAWAGRHEDAIALATTALAGERLAPRIASIFSTCAPESHIALGKLDAARRRCAGDARLAKRARKHRAACTGAQSPAFVEIRSGNSRDGRQDARATRGKRRTAAGDKALEAHEPCCASARRSSESRDNEDAATASALAARMFKALGQPVYEGRALWALSAARSGQGRRRPRPTGAAHGRWHSPERSGDLYGIGNAINMLTFHEPDIASAAPAARSRSPRSAPPATSSARR